MIRQNISFYFLILLLLFFTKSGAQNRSGYIDGLKICSTIQSNSFTSNKIADDALDKILGTIGASKRFILQPCNRINNAIATSYKGIRYILYDPSFMYSLSNGNDWKNLFILAHEVGHHINGHSLDLMLYSTDAIEQLTLAEKRLQELEADEFAGFVLAKLGGSIAEANVVISEISDDSDDSYKTHPSRQKRLEAVERGYNKASNSLNSMQSSPEQISQDYFYKALEKENNNDTLGAIQFYSIAIAYAPDLSSTPYLGRGNLYRCQFRFDEALSDINKAIKIDSSVGAFLFRARVYMGMSPERDDPNMYKAIDDLTVAINISDKSDGLLYLWRGRCKWRTLGWAYACEDYKTALSLGGLSEEDKEELRLKGCDRYKPWIIESLEKYIITEFTELFEKSGISKFKIKKLIINHREGDEFVGSIDAKIDGKFYSSEILIIWDGYNYSFSYDEFLI